MKDFHENSLVTYAETTEERQARKVAVLDVYRKNPEQPLTDRQVAYSLGFRDMNAVRPRITELIKAGDLIEVGKERDALTKKPVRLSRLSKREEQIRIFE